MRMGKILSPAERENRIWAEVNFKNLWEKVGRWRRGREGMVHRDSIRYMLHEHSSPNGRVIKLGQMRCTVGDQTGLGVLRLHFFRSAARCF